MCILWFLVAHSAAESRKAHAPFPPRRRQCCALVRSAHSPSQTWGKLQVRGIACQHPNSLVYVAGAPAHGQHDKDGDPWLKMDGSFSERHLIEPMRLITKQCAVPPHNLVRAALRPETGFGSGWHAGCARLGWLAYL